MSRKVKVTVIVEDDENVTTVTVERAECEMSILPDPFTEKVDYRNLRRVLPPESPRTLRFDVKPRPEKSADPYQPYGTMTIRPLEKEPS
jgi:hypothetical protein